jgi:hypothetical protein
MFGRTPCFIVSNEAVKNYVSTFVESMGYVVSSNFSNYFKTDVVVTTEQSQEEPGYSFHLLEVNDNLDDCITSCLEFDDNFGGK